jgi:hypothetical protein
MYPDEPLLILLTRPERGLETTADSAVICAAEILGELPA